MTHLRKMMLEELERRNYAQTTIDCYLQTVEDFTRYFRRPPRVRVFSVFVRPPAEQPHPGAHPPVPSVFVPREKASRIHRYATTCGSAVLLHADDSESLERGRDTVSEENATPAQHLEPRRSRPPHRFLPDSLSSRCTDDALWHRGTACRVDSLTNPRHQQPAHGHPHPRWEGSSGPRCHAQSHAAGSLARTLAWPEAQTHRLAIPRRALAHRPSSHHSQGSVLCVPMCRPASWSSVPGSSPH